MESHSDSSLERFVNRESLWKTVENKTTENSIERSEIKEIVGHSLVDETIDLHMELLSLNEIWKEFNQNSDAVNKLLPEPPFLRENLEKQITLLVELLQQKMEKHEGEMALPAVLSDEEREIIKSVSRCNPVQTVRNCSSQNSSRESTRTSSPFPLEEVNIFQIDKLALVLRQCFEEERENLLHGIAKLQAALVGGCEARESQANERQSSPTIKKLQHLNNKLEKEVVSHDSQKPSVQKVAGSKSANCKNSKWSNNFQKPVKLTPSPPSTANTSSYIRPNLLPMAHPSVKVSVQTITLP